MCRNNWKAFGPTSEFSEGDADYFRLTNRLSEQYGLFRPPQEPDQEDSGIPSEAQQPTLLSDTGRPEFGLSPKQIAALGLSGPQASLPDPVSAASEGPWCLDGAHRRTRRAGG